MPHKHAGRLQMRTALSLIALLVLTPSIRAAEPPVYLRFRVQQPATGPLEARVGGVRKQGPKWDLPTRRIEVTPGAWSPWIDLTDWPLHKRMNRAGGVAEWPSGKISLQYAGRGEPVRSCTVDLQLNDRAAEPAIISATETSGYDAVWFLIPRPVRENASQFETGSQMTARHLQWAQEIVGHSPIRLKKFDVCTSLWGEPDPALAALDLKTLSLLGFNVVNGPSISLLRESGMNLLGKSWGYVDDPAETASRGGRFREKRGGQSDDDRWERAHTRHVVINDEVKSVTFRRVDPARRDTWFREYLTAQKVDPQLLGGSLDSIHYPYDALTKEALPATADLTTRRLLYHASKFRQWWSARQLRGTSDRLREFMPDVPTETLPTSHGFLAAWGAPHTGMSYSLLDLFEVGRQRSVDILSAEDWLGLNHMYGPAYTWTGAQSFEYLSAIMRSAMAGSDMRLLSLITPSDDHYLQLKAFSSLGQGARAFFFWTYGPTFMGDENYWSDLRSEYEGIVSLTRILQKSEDVLASARVVSDPVAILYSVSHDIWHTKRRAAFVEKRLLWHALRHLGIQPDFVSEEDVAAGRLEKYRLLLVSDHCVAHAAGERIDAWVRKGGTVYLSAGAATHDEYDQPSPPPFVSELLAPDWLSRFQEQTDYKFNERTDLPEVKPLGQVSVRLDDRAFAMPSLGCRVSLRSGAATFATFDNGEPAGVQVACGQGRVWALGFMPMLAYGQGAGFAPKSLKEKWPEGPRALVKRVLRSAAIEPVAQPDHPVVEASLLRGPKASALVLANYTYEPIQRLSVFVRGERPVLRGVSCATGRPVDIESSALGVRVVLPLEWTDVVILEHD